MTYLTKYVSVNNVLDFLLNHMKMFLGDKLRGVYLFGSLVSGDFDENISDIDLMVALNGTLTDLELDALKQMHDNCASEFTDWNDRIEVAYITTDALKTFKEHPSVIAIISPGELFHTKTAGIDWLINWYQIREQGEVLFGPAPSSLIAPISKDEYIQAVSDQLREWVEWVETSHTRGFQAYAILTMCRGMYAIRFGKQVSKLKAANWVEEQYPEWAELIQTALKWRTHQLKEGKIEDSEAHVETLRFIHFVKYIDWAKRYLISNRYAIKTEAMLIQSAPWSTVWRFETEHGFIYFKRSIPEFFIETSIINIINEVNPDCVPKVIAVNQDLHCFLMLDAGVTLRERFKHQFDSDLLVKVVEKYTLLQCKISAKSDALIEAGAPDWRLRKLPYLYANVIDNDMLLNEIGITDSEKAQLHALKLKFTEICERLAFYKIPETLNHADFHDNNVLYDEKNHHLTVIDLGEVVISHPFFSLHSLFFMQQYWGYFKKDDQDYLKIKNACFHHFRQFESEQHLQEIFDLTLLLHPLFYVFSLIRLINACEKEGYRPDFKGADGIVKSLQAQKDNIAGCLRQFIVLTRSE